MGGWRLGFFSLRKVLAIMKWSFATTDGNRVAPNEFKDLTVYFHSRPRYKL
jgi:hypothetical protein